MKKFILIFFSCFLLIPLVCNFNSPIYGFYFTREDESSVTQFLDITNVLSIRMSDGDIENIASEYDLNYAEYGEYRINLSYQEAKDQTITSKLLDDSRADVLLLDNIYTSFKLLTTDEINVIRDYVLEGHGLVGTHGTLEPTEHSKLASLFGINPAMIAATDGLMPIIGYSGAFYLSGLSHPILNHIPENYHSESTATMAAWRDGEAQWTDEDDILLSTGTLLTTSIDGYCAMIITDEGIYKSVYFTHLPCQSIYMNIDDYQLLYNSLIWTNPQYSITASEQDNSSDSPTLNLTPGFILPVLIFAFWFISVFKRDK